ncbi:MAG: shikimate kinase / 3-dehydroquinate synthase [Thermoleophilaceae bacterium]|nr:shikimate kinase / 3-dehydroquinate synthase [Thermoleophilaceae bacterium]
MEAVAAAGSAAGAGDGSGRGRAIVFVGFMGAGKSSAARSAAAELGVAALDSDRELEQALGEPIETFFDREGEAEFRRREEQLILELLARADGGVVALGGGALGSDRVTEALAGHVVVHIEVSPGDAWRRASGKGRPLARDRARFDALFAERRARYEAAADAIVLAADRGVAVRALPALLALREAPAGTRLVWASAASGDYPVFLGRGLAASGFFHPLDGRRFAVTDENVAGLHRIEADAYAAIPAGESEKTLARAEEVLRRMAAEGIAGDDMVAAVGGGVVGDLGGFCAAVYQRGIRHVQVPTTLVAQVDSAYGGKTGVDLPEGKNYVGAYRQPSAVLVDPATLDTLPPEERAAGYAEVVKTALIAGGELWARVRSGQEPDAGTILGCLRTKLAVVAEDERDEGRRQVLNLGHTVGHAIEAATGYSRFRHGEAVAIGLLCALRLSGREPLRREVSALLRDHGLPLAAPGVDAGAVLELVGRDKKRRGGRVPFVLVEAPGQVTPGHDVPDEELRAAVEEVCAG